MELFATSLALEEANQLLGTITQAGNGGHPLWRPLTFEWMRRAHSEFGPDMHGQRSLEFFRLRCEADQIGDHFSLFQQRFRRSMEKNGFPKNFAYALTKVLSEMTDNVIQHSGRTADGFDTLRRPAMPFGQSSNEARVRERGKAKVKVSSNFSNRSWTVTASSGSAAATAR